MRPHGKEADVIVVGSGAGGATVARELARGGKEVLLLERGGYHRRFLGTHLGAALMADRFTLRFSEGGVRRGMQVLSGRTVGGTTLFTCGTYREPAPFIREKLGIDLSREIAETRQELGVCRIPDRFIAGASAMLLEAACSLGYRWEVFEKFLDPARCREGCSACMLTCPTGAKWTARVYVEEARRAGATLVERARVERVIQEGGRAVGVRARVAGRPVELRAPLVVLSAGGMGSTPILLRSGVEEAGRGIFVDPLVVVSGVYQGAASRAGSCYNPPMSVGSWEFYDSEGFMLAPLLDPWLLFWAGSTLVSARKFFDVLRYRRVMGIMTKIKDDLAGELRPDGSFAKPLTGADRRKLDRGAAISREILVRAGCGERTLATSLVRGAHPGGACPIGTVLDADCQVRRIRSLYVCDASVFPEALGTPVVATVVAMGKRLARRLLAGGGGAS